MGDIDARIRAFERLMGLPQDIIDAPVENVTATTVMVSKPKGLLYYLSEPSIAMPHMGIMPESFYDPTAAEEVV